MLVLNYMDITPRGRWSTKILKASLSLWFISIEHMYLTVRLSTARTNYVGWVKIMRIVDKIGQNAHFGLYENFP